jgi:hypothetical protein
LALRGVQDFSFAPPAGHNMLYRNDIFFYLERCVHEENPKGGNRMALAFLTHVLLLAK